MSISFSAVCTYLSCPKKYSHYYLENTPVNTTYVEEALVKGTLTHQLIQTILEGGDHREVFSLVLSKWLEKECRIPVVQTEEEMQSGLGVVAACVEEYATQTSQLLKRCHVSYQEADAIRNRDGSVPLDPLEYPPKEFSKLYNDLGLPELRQFIDNAAVRQNRSLVNFSVSNVAASAYTYAELFQYPEWFGQTLGVEIAFDHSGWRGAIDWVFETKEGKLVICDHKTSSKCPEGLDVLWHPQLNLYASVYYELTGKLASYLAINHLPSQRIVVAQLEVSRMLSILENFTRIRQDIRDRKNMDLRRFPGEYQSPCITRNWKTGVITSVCPYLETCWPSFYKDCGEDG